MPPFQGHHFWTRPRTASDSSIESSCTNGQSDLHVGLFLPDRLPVSTILGGYKTGPTDADPYVKLFPKYQLIDLMWRGDGASYRGYERESVEIFTSQYARIANSHWPKNMDFWELLEWITLDFQWVWKRGANKYAKLGESWVTALMRKSGFGILYGEHF